MSRNEPKHPAPQDTPQRMLDQLEADLRRHLGAGPSLTPADVRALIRHAEQVAEALSAAPARSVEDATGRAERIRRLYDQLALAVRQQHAEAAERLGKMRRGKAALKVYGGRG